MTSEPTWGPSDHWGTDDPAMPDSLYHYTTAAGLLGIITSASLWASDFRFMNDPSEGLLGTQIFIDALNAMAPEEVPEGVVVDLETWAEIFGAYRDEIVLRLSSLSAPIYVASLCESPDLLSQWRAYGGDGGAHGYAIEFRSSAVAGAVRSLDSGLHTTRLERVRYGTAAASEVLANGIEWVKNDTNLGHYGVHAHFMSIRLASLLATVKHEGFAGEGEWRLIATDEVDPPPARFRPHERAIIPYLEVPLPPSSIASITIGPGPDAPLRVQGAERLLRHAEVAAPVVLSSVQLRR